MNNLYRIEARSIQCWSWHAGGLTRTTLPIPNPPCAIWEVLNDLGYLSVSMYKGKGGLITYLYRRFEADTMIPEMYVALTIVSAVGSIYDDPEVFQRGELVLLADWSAAIAYLGLVLPVVRDAEETDHNWDRGG